MSSTLIAAYSLEEYPKTSSLFNIREHSCDLSWARLVTKTYRSARYVVNIVQHHRSTLKSDQQATIRGISFGRARKIFGRSFQGSHPWPTNLITPLQEITNVSHEEDDVRDSNPSGATEGRYVNKGKLKSRSCLRVVIAQLHRHHSTREAYQEDVEP